MKKNSALLFRNAHFRRVGHSDSSRSPSTITRRSKCRSGATVGGACELQRLYLALNLVRSTTNPRTAKLLASGSRKISRKVIEEAGEVALEAVKHCNRGIIRESADLLYHLTVLWHRAGIDPDDVWAEMRRRAELFGIAEKLQKPPKSDASVVRDGAERASVLERGRRHVGH